MILIIPDASLHNPASPQLENQSELLQVDHYLEHKEHHITKLIIQFLTEELQYLEF